MASSHLCTFLVEEKVRAWGGGAQWKHPIQREKCKGQAGSKAGWEPLSPTLHHVFMGSLSKAL